MENYSLRKNPSRENCEEMIKRILNTEIQENGTNMRFQTAADFLPYFESLYPASKSLTEQVQRAVKALDLSQDAKGYLLMNKTAKQLEEEQVMKDLLADVAKQPIVLGHCTTIFLPIQEKLKDYYLQNLLDSSDFTDLIITAFKTVNGILIFTHEEEELCNSLSALMN